MSENFGYHDAMLIASLVYMCFDLQSEWNHFSTCSKPIHKWLLVSYLCVMSSRITHLLGSRAAAAAVGNVGHGSREFLLDLRQKGAVTRVMLSFTWVAALPFFCLLTVLGTVWLWQVNQETPQCMPSAVHLWFAILWLLICYLWILTHAVLATVAVVLERRVRRAEGDLREIEDDDVRQRWGQVSRITGYNGLAHAAVVAAGGLSPASIKALPCAIETCACEEAANQSECSICIMEVSPGDAVRNLPGCGHRFHRSCIDLWLLRSAACPLCKRPVVTSEDSVWV